MVYLCFNLTIKPMKKVLLLLFVVGCALTACEKESESISPKQFDHRVEPLADVIRIAQKGAAMLSDETSRSVIDRRVDQGAISCKIKPSTRSGEVNDTLYYVVNYADDAGFAIVSAQQDAKDGERLLAVVERGNYEVGNITGVGGFDAFIGVLDSISIPPKDSIQFDLSHYETETTESTWTSVGPYLSVMWGQGGVVEVPQTSYDSDKPYNKYCLKNDLLCPAGCGAVAMAQIMSYHKVPDSYVRTYVGGNESHVLDWDSIVSWVGGKDRDPAWCEEDGDAIAHLMREMGYRVNATYTYSGTTFTYDQVRSVFMSFGYTASNLLDYSCSSIKNQLSQKRPVFVGGQRLVGYDDSGNAQYSGHAWVADGYKHWHVHYITYKVTPTLLGERREIYLEEDYDYDFLHYNWGYDGKCNGYFSDGIFKLNQSNASAGGFDNPDYSNTNSREYSYYVKMLIPYNN